MLSVMYLEWDIEWESSMVVAIFTVLLVGFILGGSTVYLIENHFRTKEMNKIYKLTESLINGNDLDDSDIGMERQLLFYVCDRIVVYCRSGSFVWSKNLHGK